MYVDPNGEFLIEAVMLLGYVAYASTALLSAYYIGYALDQAGVDDVLNDFSQSVVNSIGNIRDQVKEVICSTTVAVVTTILSEIEQSNKGAYVIQFSSGNYYIGKGSPLRMYTSAMIKAVQYGELPVSFRHEGASNVRQAFILEYKWMVEYGYESGSRDFYNRIWSPGRLYYWQDNHGTLYLNDYWGR